MPRGDRTGPDGMGAMTGRGMGFCNGYNSSGFTRGNPRGGAGFNRGYGRMTGRGFRRGNCWGYRDVQAYPAQTYRMTKADESKMIQDQISLLKEELNTLETRLSEISSED